MKRSLVIVACLALCLLAASPAMATSRRGTRGDRCFFVVAGKDATADGSILLGYANDWASTNWMSMQVMRHGDAGAGFLKFRTSVASAAGGVNEHQLSVIFGAETDIADVVLEADPYKSSGFGYGLWDRLLRTCRTARQAIDTLAHMAEGRGFSPQAAGSLAVADTDEAWVFETLGGHHWVAVRVPDDAVWIHPNMVCVRTIDQSDPSTCRGSADLAAFAERLGRYDPTKGPLDVAWAFNKRRELSAYYNKNRLWGPIHLLAPHLGLPPPPHGRTSRYTSCPNRR